HINLHVGQPTGAHRNQRQQGGCFDSKSDQKRIFTASCTMRGEPALVSRPKFALVKPVTGLPKFVRLNTLNASSRSSPAPVSPRNGKRRPLTREVSTVALPGPSSTFRPSVPTVPGSALMKRVLSKYASIFAPLLRPESRTGFPVPVRFARAAKSTPANGSPVAATLNGQPDWNDVMPLSRQFCKTALTIGEPPFGPGNCQTNDVTNRGGVFWSAGPRVRKKLEANDAA